MRRVGLLLACACACATTKPDRARREVGDMLEARAGVQDAITARQDARSREAVRGRVQALLAEPLSVDRALVIALLNNRELQATLEELGVAQAELVQAGLLENPTLAGDLVNSTKGNGLGGGLSLSTSLLSAFLIPAKRRLAKAQLRHAIVSVGDAALELVAHVRVAYADVQAAFAERALHRELVQVAEVADELAANQFDAGNITQLDRERFAAALDEARLSLVDYEVALVEARAELNVLLGLWGADTGWRLAGELAPPGAAEPELGALESRGIRDRLDVSAARAERDAMLLALKLRRRGVVPAIEVGVEARNEVGNDAGHEWVLGPSLSVELPIFDPGHADFARLRALLRQAEHHLQAEAIEARAEIRVQRERLVAARRKVEYYAKTVLPRREVIAARALEQYNGMLLGTYELLETRSQQVEVREGYVRALRDYWVARAELERAVGGRLE